MGLHIHGVRRNPPFQFQFCLGCRANFVTFGGAVGGLLCGIIDADPLGRSPLAVSVVTRHRCRFLGLLLGALRDRNEIATETKM